MLGRPSRPVKWYLRLMFLKFRHGLRYETLCAEVSDSISWRRFCRSRSMERCRIPRRAVAAPNEALWAKAAVQKLLRIHRVRTDTTVISANVAYPTDSGLLAKAVGKLVRTARRVQAAGGATGTVMTDRRRGATSTVRGLRNSRPCRVLVTSLASAARSGVT